MYEAREKTAKEICELFIQLIGEHRAEYLQRVFARSLIGQCVQAVSKTPS
jgi:hypothetical protein